MNAEKEVHVGELVRLYEGMTKKGVSAAERLKQAEMLCADPPAVAEAFNADVNAFLAYNRPELEFHGGDKGKKKRDELEFNPRSKTRLVAAALNMLKSDTVVVAGRPELNFRYVDRELVTARTPGSYFGRKPSGEPRPATGAPKLDLLLANAEDQMPIAAELKVADDKDPFYALIQALAHATMLVTPNQLERLHRQYRDTFDPGASKIDVYVVLAGRANGNNWEGFHEKAERLREGLVHCEPFTQWVRRVAEIKLSIGAS